MVFGYYSFLVIFKKVINFLFFFRRGSLKNIVRKMFKVWLFLVFYYSEEIVGRVLLVGVVFISKLSF